MDEEQYITAHYGVCKESVPWGKGCDCVRRVHRGQAKYDIMYICPNWQRPNVRSWEEWLSILKDFAKNTESTSSLPDQMLRKDT